MIQPSQINMSPRMKHMLKEADANGKGSVRRRSDHRKFDAGWDYYKKHQSKKGTK